MLAVALAGCGPLGDDKLSTEDASAVSKANLAFSGYCADQSREALGEEPLGLSDTGFEDVLEGVRVVTAIYRKDPDAIYQPGGEGEKLTMREVVADAANTLDDCSPEESRELDRVLDAS